MYRSMKNWRYFKLLQICKKKEKKIVRFSKNCKLQKGDLRDYMVDLVVKKILSVFHKDV